MVIVPVESTRSFGSLNRRCYHFLLVFPEQRDFFLEGSSVFNFSTSNRPNPYFSRRIGLVEGMPIPIVYGARLAGQASLVVDFRSARRRSLAANIKFTRGEFWSGDRTGVDAFAGF